MPKATSQLQGGPAAAGETVSPRLGTSTGTGPRTGVPGGAEAADLGGAAGVRLVPGPALGGRLTGTALPGRLTPRSEVFSAEVATGGTAGPVVETVAAPGGSALPTSTAPERLPCAGVDGVGAVGVCWPALAE